MLQFDVALHRTKDNVAHRVRRYRNCGSVGVYLRRWAGLVPDVQASISPVRIHGNCCLYPTAQPNIAGRDPLPSVS